MYTNSLRKRLKDHMHVNNVSAYKIEMLTGIHRQIVKNFVNGKGLNYENGMTIRTYIKSNLKNDTLKMQRG